MRTSDVLHERLQLPAKANKAATTKVLIMKAHSLAQRRRTEGHLGHHQEKEAVDAILQVLLSNANQELATLLRDVRTARQGRRRRDTEGWRSKLLMRAVRCAATQHALQAELRELALKDELTGLHNRRGFYALAENQCKVAFRSGRGMLLFFIDVDGLKEINDSLGHAEGDRALKRTAEILKKTFRDSDIVARLGGDEFAVLAIEASGHSEATITARLHRYVQAANVGEPRCGISISVGVARFDHRNPVPITELMDQADKAMYEQKWSQANLLPVPDQQGSSGRLAAVLRSQGFESSAVPPGAKS
jgi:diguanylate cyclase (GGDEF)-like protein